MTYCKQCKNPLRTREIRQDFNGPMGKVRYINEEYCPYCEWKDTTGPGAQLKQLIKEHNANVESIHKQ